MFTDENKYKEQERFIDESCLELGSQIVLWQKELSDKKEALKDLDISISPPLKGFEEFIINPLKSEIDDLEEKIRNSDLKFQELTQNKINLSLTIARLSR